MGEIQYKIRRWVTVPVGWESGRVQHYLAMDVDSFYIYCYFLCFYNYSTEDYGLEHKWNGAEDTHRLWICE